MLILFVPMDLEGSKLMLFMVIAMNSSMSIEISFVTGGISTDPADKRFLT